MRFEVAEVPDGNREARAFRKMAGRVPVPLHPIFLQCELDHRAKKSERWVSLQITKTPIANGCSAETIRKHIRK
jgi:hypothetical protein